MGNIKSMCFVRQRLTSAASCECWKCLLAPLSSFIPFIALSCQSLHRDSHQGKQVNYCDEMCCCPTNQLWPCVAVGWGDARLGEGYRVGNQGILTQGNGNVMGCALESAGDHSSTPPCLLFPPPSCCTASLTPNTHCVFPTFTRLPPPSLSSCPSLTAFVFHFSTCRVTSGGSRHLVNRFALHLWLKNTFVQLCQGRNVSLCCWLLSGPASHVSLEYWFIHRSEVIAALGTLK